MQKVLILIGVMIVAAGLFWPWLSQLPLGRLPGDIAVKREGGAFFFPIMTCLLISAVLTILLRLFGGR